MKPTLSEIKNEFLALKSKEMPQLARNKAYARLMDKLENYYGSLVLEPTQLELERPDVLLYHEISEAREF